MPPSLTRLLSFWPLALALASLYAGWHVQGWRCEAGKQDELRSAVAAKAEAEQKARWHAEVLEVKFAALEDENRTLTRRLHHETRQDAYRCPLPVNGMRVHDAHRRGTGLPPEPHGTLP